MNFADKEILELNELCNALIEGTLNDAQKSRLSQWLATSEDARRFYVRVMGLSASLFSYASEMQTEPAEVVAPSEKIIHLEWVWKFGSLAAAAAIALMLWIEWPKINAASAGLPADEFVAQLTGSKECQWADSNSSVQPGGRLHKGQRIELAKGFAEITFDSGAQIILEGPASLDINSAWAATLNRGALKASVPPEAMGFSISNPTVEVVDLGTEFTMFADAIGSATEVLVLKGEVEAQSSTAADQQPIVLREKDARRFAVSGVSTMQGSEPKLAQLSQSVPLDHFIPPTDYVHWSFDEADGNIFKADASGSPFDAADARLEDVSPSTFGTAHGSGRWGHALHFDGHLYAKAAFPGISKNSPHTVAFWVKIPKDANLSTAYAMVAWGMNSKKLGSHPIHIGWNRNPNEGTVGALRTDYGGGFAIGATSLLDGHWHHVAAVFIPGEDSKTPMEVNQYVDGRFEGEGKSSPPGSDIFAQPSDVNSSVINDTVWLGCRLGINKVRQERFRGEMDELFIADRALEPVEIVSLMNDNQLPQSELASVQK